MRDTEIVPTHLSAREISLIISKIATAVYRIRAVVQKYHPIKTIGLFSGGHDSVSACYVLSQAATMWGGDFEIVHVNTGFGVEATREYVRSVCKEHGWPLREMKASENRKADGTPDPQIYEDIVKKYGFPGPGWHGRMYQRLKERALRMVERHHGATCRGKHKKRVLYVNGCRSQESKRRMANTQELQIDGRRIWCAPIHDWSKLETSLCLEYAHIPRNPVVDLIHMSGECLCGAMAGDHNEQELAELAQWPITRPAYERIMALQAIVKPLKGWGWGERPPEKIKPCKEKPGQLCWSCMK